MRHFLQLAIGVLLGLCICVTSGRAAERPVLPENFTFSDVTYSKGELYKAFFGITRLRPHGIAAYPTANNDEYGVLNNPSGYKARYPWLYEYIAREKGMPNYWGIYKWTKPVIISAGLPFDLKSASGHEGDGPYLYNSVPKDMPDNLEDIARSEVEAAFPFLEKNTGLTFSYLPHSVETQDKYGSLRIVFMDARDYCDWQTKYKKGKSLCERRSNFRSPGFLPVPFRHIVEKRLLPTAIRFASSSQQVDGFFLPEADNSIGMSFCFIYYKHEEEMMRGLIRECLIRSLGFAADTGWRQTISGGWNKTEADEKVPDYLSSSYRPPYLKPGRRDRVVDGNDLLNTIITGKAYVSEDNKLDPRAFPPDFPPPFSDFERVLLQGLYHPRVKPGMTEVELMRAMDMPLP